ncbi:hypothetical protein NDU88_005165 [Pleurodeles waltl]|uniref:Uncharacterized protein n=1 Tax=Pleurodeles waltl TaxID=8319 RepID=A0AAV7SKY1_PLEWA|nr:hypothetical protein NDU88_005165 [Pleurodeles waltl]
MVDRFSIEVDIKAPFNITQSINVKAHVNVKNPSVDGKATIIESPSINSISKVNIEAPTVKNTVINDNATSVDIEHPIGNVEETLKVNIEATIVDIKDTTTCNKASSVDIESSSDNTEDYTVASVTFMIILCDIKV